MANPDLLFETPYSFTKRKSTFKGLVLAIAILTLLSIVVALISFYIHRNDPPLSDDELKRLEAITEDRPSWDNL